MVSKDMDALRLAIVSDSSGDERPEAIERTPGARFCPICRRASVPEYRPFCSKRCADIDLGHWLSDSYAIPVVEEDGADDE